MWGKKKEHRFFFHLYLTFFFHLPYISPLYLVKSQKSEKVKKKTRR